MACLETCFDCGGSGCDVCNFTGGIVVDTMVWGAARGYNAMPTAAAQIKKNRKREEKMIKKNDKRGREKVSWSSKVRELLDNYNRR